MVLCLNYDVNNQFMLLLPSSKKTQKQNLQVSHISDLLNIYEDDLPALIRTELHCLNLKWESSDKEANTIHESLAVTDIDFFSNIRELLKIGCTLCSNHCRV